MAGRKLNRAPLRTVTAAALAALLLAALPASAGAHAAFLDSTPAPGSRLQSGPAQITLDFTEPLNQSLSNAKLIDTTTGKAIPARSSASERELTLQPLARLQKGAYRVDWHTVSTLDGHALEGSFGFGVRVAPTFSEGSVEQSPLARDGWLRILLRGAMYGLLFFFAGGVAGAAILAPRRGPAEWLVPAAVAPQLETAGAEPEAVSARCWARTLNAGWLALAATVAVAVAEAADASSGLSLGGLSDFLLSNGAGLARVGTVVSLALAVLAAPRLPRVAAGCLAVTFGTIAFSGHANSADPRSLALLTDWVHLIAGAVWVGGIAQLAWAWLPLIRRIGSEARLAVIRDVLDRFGRIALPAFLVVMVSGLGNALIQLGHPAALWETAYGRVLAVKIALVGLIAIASYGHALRLRPRLVAANPHPGGKLERRHWRLLGVEPWLGVGVVAAAAALVAFPLPPRQLNQTEEAEAATPCEPSCPLPAAAADELPVATHAGPNIAAFWLRREGGEVTGTMRLLNVNEKPVSASVALPGGSAESCGTGCWQISAPATGRRLSGSVSDETGTHQVGVPDAWDPRRTRQAQSLVVRAQRAMRSLSTARLHESVSSGLGQTVRTRYRFQAPDRMEYVTQSGARYIAIAKTAYESTNGGPFKKGPFGAQTGFQFAQFFRWSVYDRSVRWLGANRRVVHLALFDPGTPAWYLLTIERATDRVPLENLTTSGHFMTRRWSAFDQPLQIQAPR